MFATRAMCSSWQRWTVPGGVFEKLDPNGHDGIGARYSINGWVQTGYGLTPGRSREFKPGDAVKVYYRSTYPNEVRFVRPARMN
jgi:hypothetical protein